MCLQGQVAAVIVVYVSRLLESNTSLAVVGMLVEWCTSRHIAGTGVHVYILDTGIRTTHEEFWDEAAQRSRAVHGFDAVYGTNSSEDCHGHGSHVAAVVGGNTFGVAKNVTLHAVRVLACDGTAMVSALLKVGAHALLTPAPERAQHTTCTDTALY